MLLHDDPKISYSNFTVKGFHSFTGILTSHDDNDDDNIYHAFVAKNKIPPRMQSFVKLRSLKISYLPVTTEKINRNTRMKAKKNNIVADSRRLATLPETHTKLNKRFPRNLRSMLRKQLIII